MAITPSSAARIDGLVADLASESAVARETAVARLTVIGARTVSRLIALVDSNAHQTARAAALRALESIADPRAIDPALRAIDAPEADVASAGISAARAFLRGPRSAAVVDRLTAVALDPARAERVRVSALEALGDLTRATIAPLLDALGNDASDLVRKAARRSLSFDRGDTLDPAAEVARAADGTVLPDDPAGLRRALALSGDRVTLSQLLRVIERIRDHEPSEKGARRAEWTRVRGMAHVALARRGSRVAIYDLRESIEGAPTPLPVEFLAALAAVGDTSCLEGLAAAYARSMRAGSVRRDWWRAHLASTFRTIASRTRVTGRHATLKRIQKRWPGLLPDLMRAGPLPRSGN